MHSSLAEYLLIKAEQTNDTLTPMQIVKLVYLCHGWMLGLHGRHLIEDDVEAWRYGPIIRILYTAVKKFRSHPVELPLIKNAQAKNSFSDEEKDIMNQVFDIYGKRTGIQLSRLTMPRGLRGLKHETPTTLAGMLFPMI